MSGATEPTAPVRRPALRYHGAKFRLASWVLQFFPPHTTYVEPFGGAAGVLLQKPRSYAEVYNDLDGDIANYFRVLRDPKQRAQLIEAVMLTPYSREEFEAAWEDSNDPIERARRIAIRAQMGFGSAGATKGQTGFRSDSKREGGLSAHLWASFPRSIADAGKRLQGVIIENRPAVQVMLDHDGVDTLHFVDPPYVHSARSLRAGPRRHYRHEMTDQEHVDLIECVRSLQGMVIICGYRTALYSDRLKDWTLRTTKARISAGRGTAMRTECLWFNNACARRQAQICMGL